MLFSRKEKLRVKEEGNHADLEALVSVNTAQARGFRAIAERHYTNDNRDADLYPVESKVSFLNRRNGIYVYNCDSDKVYLHTSQGYLDSNINRDNQLSVKAQGTRDFVRDFYRYLFEISQ